MHLPRDCSLEYRMMDKFKKKQIPWCYTPSSQPIRISYFPFKEKATGPKVAGSIPDDVIALLN
jgi:hypothetical protein